ncbi:MAG: hypothetical protein ACP5D2_00825 [Candidatus Nanoarchaeia archaeon]
MASRKARGSKKKHLEKQNKRTNWAPIWTVLRKFGQGKRVHPSAITRVRRNWRIRKLKIKPRKVRKDYLG